MSERKTAFITGAASGIGRATTERFSWDRKYNPVYAVDRNPAICNTFPQSEYPNIIPVQADVRDYEGIRNLLRKITLESGRLDVVVNAAGVMITGNRKTFYDQNGKPAKELEEMNLVNLYAPIVIMVETSTIMRNNGGGVIVNITSAKHLFPDIHHIHYQNGKSDLSKVTRGAARYWQKKDNIRLVDIQPGNTKTSIDQNRWPDGNNESEVAAAHFVNKWWRDKFGNDPKKVADIIYSVAEGQIKGTTVRVGLDSKLGHLMRTLTYILPYIGPISAFIGVSLWTSLFYQGSAVFYKTASLGNRLTAEFRKQT